MSMLQVKRSNTKSVKEEVMKLIIKGTEKEIADFVYLLQSQRKVERKPYSDKKELVPVTSAECIAPKLR